jgi:hypothetical protein
MLGFGDGFAGDAVNEDGIGGFAGRPVDEQHALAFRRKMFVAPRQESDQHRPKIAAPRRRHILVARRMLAIAAALQQPRLDQRIEAPRQHIRGDAEAFRKLIETRVAMQRVGHDQDRPPFADALQAAGDRTGHAGQALVLHAYKNGTVTIIMQVTG